MSTLQGINSFQFAYHAYHSSEIALLYDRIGQCTLKLMKKIKVIIALDVLAVFGTINHSRLLRHLHDDLCIAGADLNESNHYYQTGSSMSSSANIALFVHRALQVM